MEIVFVATFIAIEETINTPFCIVWCWQHDGKADAENSKAVNSLIRREVSGNNVGFEEARVVSVSSLQKRGSYVACCSNCGTFLQEAQSDCRCNVICPGCGESIVVIVKKGKVTVFEDNNCEEDHTYKEKAQILSYAKAKRNYVSLVAEPEQSYK